MPTPARRATASRLASGPPAENTAFAASSTRSRLRTASARGLRRFVAGPPDILKFSSPSLDRPHLAKRRHPPYNEVHHARPLLPFNSSGGPRVLRVVSHLGREPGPI